MSDSGLLATSYLTVCSRSSVHRLANGSRTLLVPNRSRVSKVTIHPTKQSTYAAHRDQFKNTSTTNAASTSNKVGVNKDFFCQLRAILRIIVPRKRSKEVALIIAHSSFLLLRTYLSLLVAKLDGKLVGDLVSPWIEQLCVDFWRWLTWWRRWCRSRLTGADS